VPELDGAILLCRRAIEPRKGFWTVPAGFMENGETLAEAAMRETREEAEARVELGTLFAVVDVVHARQVHVFFRGTLTAPTFGAGEETLESRLFQPAELPWDAIAFPSVTIALEQYLREQGGTPGPVHLATAPRFRLT
jgi:ADP-ribose pyrophosphatase YjhB (NUDIX family)